MLKQLLSSDRQNRPWQRTLRLSAGLLRISRCVLTVTIRVRRNRVTTFPDSLCMCTRGPILA